MSGIAGIVYPNVFQLHHSLEPMLKTLVHRGPHDQQTYTYKNFQMGIQGGHIASNEPQTLFSMLDGNIYNLPELQGELKKKGFRFRSHTTEETLLFAYQAWGDQLASHLDGDFAIAIFDRSKETLYLIRDRMGHKPLYWYHDHHHFIFASEMKALLSTGIVSQTPAPDAIAAYVSMGYIPQDMTPIQNVNKLLPGHQLNYSLREGKNIRPYWSYSSYFTRSHRDSAHDILHHLWELLKTSLLRRMPEKGSLGCLVSGGIGSASIAYMAHQLTRGGDLQAYSVGFKGENDADVEAASVVAQTLQMPQQIGWLTPENFLNDFVKVLWYLDEPLADPNVLATWKLGELASSKTNIVVSGMGSDELLAGHSRYTLDERPPYVTGWILKQLQPLLRHCLVPFLNLFNRKWAFEFLKESRMNPWQADYLKKNTLFDDKTKNAAFPSLKGLFDPDIFLQKFHNLSRIPSLVSSFLYFDVKTRLADCYMLQYDRLMSSQGLDWRPPFLDHHLVEYLAGITEPEELEEQDTALFLKNLIKNVFPEEFVNRPKKVRKNFLKPWVDLSALPQLFRLLTRGTLVETGILSYSWLTSHIATAQTQKESFSYLWTLLTLEIWFRLYINAPITDTAPQVTVEELLKRK